MTDNRQNDPALIDRTTPSNTTGVVRSIKSQFKSRRFHIILNPGKYPYFSMYMELFRKYSIIIRYFTNLKTFRYLVSGLGLSFDKKDSKHLLHIHIYVEFKESIRISPKKIFKSHIICNIDSQLSTIQYVKDQELGVIEEIGLKALCHRPTINELRNYPTEDLYQLDAQQYYNIVNKELLLRNNVMDIDEIYKKDLKVYYIYGPSGVGKSKKAFEIIKSFGYKNFDEIEYSDRFYIGVSGRCKACLYDDFRDSDMKVNEFIKFIDYNVHNLNVKGGSFKNNYKLIIFTSIRNPKNIYKNCTDNEETSIQWLRRMKIIELNF